MSVAESSPPGTVLLEHVMRTHTRNDPSIDTGSSNPVAGVDLRKLDAEANADAERQWRPKAVFVSAASHPAPDPHRDAAFAGSKAARKIPARSMFRQMMDSFFGVDHRH
jgi:hypothetical protein